MMVSVGGNTDKKTFSALDFPGISTQININPYIYIWKAVQLNSRMIFMVAEATTDAHIETLMVV